MFSPPSMENPFVVAFDPNGKISLQEMEEDTFGIHSFIKSSRCFLGMHRHSCEQFHSHIKNDKFLKHCIHNSYLNPLSTYTMKKLKYAYIQVHI